MVLDDLSNGRRRFSRKKAGEGLRLDLNRFDKHTVEIKCNGVNHVPSALLNEIPT